MKTIKLETRGMVALRSGADGVDVILNIKRGGIVIWMQKCTGENNGYFEDRQLLGTVRLSETDGTIQLFPDEE